MTRHVPSFHNQRGQLLGQFTLPLASDLLPKENNIGSSPVSGLLLLRASGVGSSRLCEDDDLEELADWEIITSSESSPVPGCKGNRDRNRPSVNQAIKPKPIQY